MPLSVKQRERRRVVLAGLDKRMRRAMRLWMSYRTLVWEYAELAESMGLTVAQLNVRCSEIYGKRIILGESAR